MFICIQVPRRTPLVVVAEQVTDHFAIYPALDIDDSGVPRFRGDAWVVQQLPTGRQMTISHEHFREGITIHAYTVTLKRVRDFLAWLETRADWSRAVRHGDVDEVTWRAILSMVHDANQWRRPTPAVAA
ncbi:hypothetical protein [Nocardia wallacei]|uniref:hypothetical protein n=1 Tax=Nocardia wallacei TaxID=480035 RepID=UPI002455ED58|nr:hypothetical protein [Nocardia wallacei]